MHSTFEHATQEESQQDTGGDPKLETTQTVRQGLFTRLWLSLAVMQEEKPDPKKNILHDYMWIRFKRRQKQYMVSEIRVMVPRRGESKHQKPPGRGASMHRWGPTASLGAHHSSSQGTVGHPHKWHVLHSCNLCTQIVSPRDWETYISG